MHKEGNELCILFIRYYMAVFTDLSPDSRSVLVTCTVRVNKQHAVNISFGLAVLESK